MTLYRDTIRIVPAYRERLRLAGLDTVDRVLKCIGDQVVAWSRSTDTVRVDLPAGAGGGAIFIKRYHLLRWRSRIKAMLRGAFLGSSRAQGEFDRLRQMLAAGAPVVRPVACGERRILHFLRSSFLITDSVTGAVSLTTFAQQSGDAQRPRLSFRERRDFVRSLARSVADLHQRGLAHGALFWRNVLVRRSVGEGGPFEFAFLDAPGRRRLNVRATDGRRSAAVVNDLAAMAALAPRFCSRSEMLRFFCAYSGTHRLGDPHRQLARLVSERARSLRDHELYRLKMDGIFHYHLVPVRQDPG
jgi:hypothetical protein